MKKVFIICMCVVASLSLHASKKGRPVRLGHFDCLLGNPKTNRAPAKVLVSLYQEEEILHVNSSLQSVLIITFKGENGSILSQEVLAGEENDVEIPRGATTVEVSYGDVELVGMLY